MEIEEGRWLAGTLGITMLLWALYWGCLHGLIVAVRAEKLDVRQKQKLKALHFYGQFVDLCRKCGAGMVWQTKLDRPGTLEFVVSAPTEQFMRSIDPSSVVRDVASALDVELALIGLDVDDYAHVRVNNDMFRIRFRNLPRLIQVARLFDKDGARNVNSLELSAGAK